MVYENGVGTDASKTKVGRTRKRSGNEGINILGPTISADAVTRSTTMDRGTSGEVRGDGDGRYGCDRAGTSGEVRGDGDGRYGCDRAGASGEVRGDGDGRHGGDRACTSGEVRGDAEGRYGRDRASMEETVKAEIGLGKMVDKAVMVMR